MNGDVSVVVTTISPPNDVLRTIAEQCARHGWNFIIAGDRKSPADFHLDGAEFLSLPQQVASDFHYARACPAGHYARKNVAYLQAIAAGSDLIVETDDDNIPRESFFATRQQHHRVKTCQLDGWINVYRYFCDQTIWPRGLPLDEIHRPLPEWHALPTQDMNCPIQQGLADENPDVDAIYRLVLPLPVNFRNDRQVALASGSWCPFNSQNTTWFPPAWPLMYLPACCSFRMTDIWRSFVAQRIAWVNGWNVLFHQPTVWQERNEHSLMSDFSDETSGYLNNRRIADLLNHLSLQPGIETIGSNMLHCYEALCSAGLVGYDEIPLLLSWLDDLRALHADRQAA